ncbi:hypothetical protein F3Y22_tig00110320pilonHSYRG00011 [Hibiscus syriacus]|uniref:Uncharacterized protein n=1 Tax=Hibiscus syriacus TaxID=106335 RepID=A0A6A3B1I8_HIBSY|nr:hypothetical protein F3Y22_tig00110320pilonHSYRG00011 [Hibiscus syriacus]
MEAKVGKFFKSVTNFFSGSDQLPWCDSDIIAGCEKEAAEADKDGVIGIGIAVIAAGLVAGGIVAALSRKN